jgi:hypothetical protein
MLSPCDRNSAIYYYDLPDVNFLANVKRQNTVFKNTVLSLKHPYFDYCKVYYTMAIFLRIAPLSFFHGCRKRRLKD